MLLLDLLSQYFYRLLRLLRKIKELIENSFLKGYIELSNQGNLQVRQSQLSVQGVNPHNLWDAIRMERVQEDPRLQPVLALVPH